MSRNLAAALDLIRRFEGIADGDPKTVNLDPYLCPANVATIGWGHAVTDQTGALLRGQGGLQIAKALYPNGLTMDEAESLLQADIKAFSCGVEPLLKRPATDNQFCAFVSLAYNIGLSGFAYSSALRHFNAGELSAVPSAIKLWNKSNGKVLAGLVNRRNAEADLFARRGVA